MFEIESTEGNVLYVAKSATDIRSAAEDAVRNRANLDGAHLEGANLVGANLYGANLVGANLDGAHLERANLVGANLYGANLVGANLYGAYLRGAFLDGASLYGASLNGASLDGANLDGAILCGASLYGAKLDEATWVAVADTLRAAAAAMNDNGRHWIKGDLSRPLDDGSTAYCSIGSVEAKGVGTARTLALWLLSSVTAGDIVRFNDHPATTWEDVTAVFAVAIRHAERLAGK